SDDGLTPVHIAAAWGRVEILNLLLASGGDPEARDANCMTPLHYARKEDYVECLDLLRSYLPIKNEILKKEKEDCENVNFKLDKVLINNGRTIGEYEVINDNQTDSIIKEKYFENLKNLPQSDTTEYVMNWFNKHVSEESGQSFIKFPKSTGGSTAEDGFLSFESSVDESDNEHLKLINVENITFRKSYRKTRNNKNNCTKASKKVKFSKFSGDNTVATDIKDKAVEFPDISIFEDAEDGSKMSQFSKESGIVTLPNSINDESNLFCDKPQDNSPEKQTNLLKSREISSDYMTCSSNSLFEQNIFDITEDGSVNLLTCEDAGSNDVSFISISEVYKYVDKDEGIVLYERRLLKTP
ncbi:homeobox protein Wariai-like, partial [Anoplophora glabripennis]|uniref:homeobox protein Wariai-like n=1 Tax=Anoplophora glabripennis TaxID=217634 RepID=UPI000874FC11